MWKCLIGALPVASALQRRSIEVDVLCRRCGEQMETPEHALRDCKWVEVMWAVSPIRLSPLQSMCSIPDWFDKIRLCPQRETHAQFATLAWAVWYARNMLLFQNKELSHLECLEIAARARWLPAVTASSLQSRASRVLCDREGQVKISTDATVREGVGIGCGAVLTFGDYEVLGCRFGFKRGEFSAVEAEALAMLEGLNLCCEHGASDIIVETDCQSLYWMVVKREMDFSYLGNTLSAIYELFCSFTHCY
ncbi:uncharacterized protein LOC131009662 [Salvia miltiorrhiza]|uniref:uncharacterized protein LOC131009662 n=1 Tax=Salvia miltiorrhiza TaxID=226208 RepID=UPI0025AC528B|nr:uncharacterized protein LOC131009662 [Salvia miltiorrhiza]